MTQRAQYLIINPADLDDLANQLNRVLSKLADRLDQIEGYRGTPTFHGDLDLQGNAIRNVGTTITGQTIIVSEVGDHGTLVGLADDDHGQYVMADGRHGGNIKVYDVNGFLLHSFEVA